jgi:RNA polymerase sigma factor (sigma-70 family)
VRPPAADKPVAEGVPQLAEHLFRHEAGKLVSVLTGIFGTDRLQMAEDVVQEALIRALQTWPYEGVPNNPAAWLMQTAKHLALDLIRREKTFRTKQPELIARAEQRLAGDGPPPMFEDEIKHERLRLLFVCAHPALSKEAQTAIALKTLCGLSPAEIAQAFLTTEAAIAKRLTRARQVLQDKQIPFEIPSGAELSARLDSVLHFLYLLFSEGYKASSGDSLIRAELCGEAIELCSSLAEHPCANVPRTHALLALMLLDASRLPARMDQEGNILRLHEQDRSRWNRKLIGRGMEHLGKAATGKELSEYHLQAGIAACHCAAPDYVSTDWRAILAHYDKWLEITDSPLVALNRAVAVAKVEGAEAGIRAVQLLQSYYLTHAILGEFDAQLHRFDSAILHLRRARELAALKSEQTFLEKRLREFEAGSICR